MNATTISVGVNTKTEKNMTDLIKSKNITSAPRQTSNPFRPATGQWKRWRTGTAAHGHARVEH